MLTGGKEYWETQVLRLRGPSTFTTAARIGTTAVSATPTVFLRFALEDDDTLDPLVI